MRMSPEMVGEAPQERDGDQREKQIEAPFAEILGRVVQQSGEFALGFADSSASADE